MTHHSVFDLTGSITFDGAVPKCDRATVAERKAALRTRWGIGTPAVDEVPLDEIGERLREWRQGRQEGEG